VRPAAHSHDGYATRAAELARALPTRVLLRRAARHGVVSALGHIPARPAPGVRIVHYHHVFDDELEEFERQLGFFTSEFEPVRLTDAVERLRTGAVAGRELVVTFDDGFRNQLRNAAPRLAAHGISACFFLITQFVSATRPLAAEICRSRLHLPRPVEPLAWAEAAELLRLGHEVGSHTRTHPNLVALEPSALEEELASSRDELERRLGHSVAHLSAPYGDRARFTEGVARAARAAGYASCSTALRGRNMSAADVFSLRRDHLEAGWPVAHVRYFLQRG
jgi:peptidoglycan/xylan/chitin deacetylase (PgdA/CDA1 family)